MRFTFSHSTTQLTEAECKNRGARLPMLKSKDITISLGPTQISMREIALQDAKGNGGRFSEYAECVSCLNKTAPLSLTFINLEYALSSFIHLLNWASRDIEKPLKSLVKREKLEEKKRPLPKHEYKKHW